MIVRKLDEILGTEREVRGENWHSRRLVLKGDGMGHSLHDTIILANTETKIWYKNHLESVYCIEGRGEIELTETGEIFPITPGTVYVLDKHDPHLLRAFEQMRMICAFTPPLSGQEVHDKDGVYPLVE